ncbi:MAG: hypothetical protein H0V76_03600 [Blastocatellia bacterium]|nr:hypothetical protein [Blastocatellia bacterium]
MERLRNAITNKFPSKRIVIIGDLVADKFLNGTIARVSREAPVFILRHDETEMRAGGAANAAVNAGALGAMPVVVGIVGNDENGKGLVAEMSAAGADCSGVIFADARRTTTKMRVLAGHHYAPKQQVIRIDYEDDTEIDAAVILQLREGLAAACDGAAAIVFSDYNYGVATAELIADALGLAEEHSIPLIVDSRSRLTGFSGATSATPNQDEVGAILGRDFTDADCERLRAEMGLKSLLVTRGNKGMTLLQEGFEPLALPVVGSSVPVDVTGAGDTVIAVFALGVASGLSFAEAAELANHAGGAVVMKRGTASVTPTELLDSLLHSPVIQTLEAERMP